MNLERRLTLFSVVSISIMSMVGTGLFALPGVIIFHTGPSAWLAYIVAGICVLPATMSKVELATAMPSTGGSYIYLERSLGPLSGIIMGLGLWLSMVLKSAFALVGLGAYLSAITSMNTQIISLFTLFVIFIVNLLGLRFLSTVFTFIVTITLISLIFLLVGAEFRLDSVNMNLGKYFSDGPSGFIMACALIFISYAGVSKIVTLAEEVKEPEKNLPKGILISLLVVTSLYGLTTYVLVDKLPLKVLNNNLRPVYDLALGFGNSNFAIFIALVACLTMAAMVNAGVLVASRFPFAMARDKLLPPFLGTLTKKFLTPLWSIVVSCLFIGLSVIFLDPGDIIKFASAFIGFIFIMENLTVIIFREMRVQWYNPTYKTPLYPFLQIMGFVAGLIFLAAIGIYYLVVSVGGITVLGLLIYLFYSRKKVKRRGLLALREGKLRLDPIDEIKPHSTHSSNYERQTTSSMVALFGEESSADNLTELALALGNKETGVTVCYMIEVPEQTNISDVDWQTPSMRSIRRRMNAISEYKKQPVYFDVVFSHDVYQRVARISEQVECRWLLTEWVSTSVGKKLTPYDPIKRLRDGLSCHMITFKDEGIRFYKKILVILSQMQHDLLNIYTADHLAQLYNGTIDFVLYEKENQRDELREYGLMLATKCQSKVSFNFIKDVDSFQETIELTSSYDLLILTDFSKNSVLERIFGTQNNKIIEKAACSVLAIQKKNN